MADVAQFGAVEIRQIGPATMVLGDMRRVLPVWPEKAALVLSDPPYRLTQGGNSTGEMAGIFARDRYDNSGALFPIVEWADMAPLIWAAARENADAIIMANDRNLAPAMAAFDSAGWEFHRLLVWDKRTVTPNRWFMQGLEFGLYLWRGLARTLNDCSVHPLVALPHQDETSHPTEKPVALMRHWLSLTTDLGDLVLDPFMRSGSVPVAAVLEGRRALGIEVDQTWFEVACARVTAAVARRDALGPDLFEGVA